MRQIAAAPCDHLAGVLHYCFELGFSRTLQGFAMTLESAYWKAVLLSLLKPSVQIIQFVPEKRRPPSRTIPVESAWVGIESILADLIDRFHLGTNSCLEFGVEHGYSTVALSSFFNRITGVDTFTGDQHTVNDKDIYNETVSRLAPFKNIQLIRCAFEDWIVQDNNSYDLIHVDIVHTYAATFACGLWSATHSRCAIFHDTKSFPAVKQAVSDIARRTGKTFYNFDESNGLGILI